MFGIIRFLFKAAAFILAFRVAQQNIHRVPLLGHFLGKDDEEERDVIHCAECLKYKKKKLSLQFGDQDFCSPECMNSFFAKPEHQNKAGSL